MGLNRIALLWGFAEATFFFIVPDVLLSIVALKSRQKATRICFWAVSGALAGGTIMFTWGALHEASADHFLEQVPAISNHLIQKVDRQVESIGSMATFAGSVTGKPYKVYAAHAGSAGLNIAIFLLISVPARLLRFLLATWIFFNPLEQPVKGYAPEAQIYPPLLLLVSFLLLVFFFYVK